MLALEGINVLELGRVPPVSFCTMILGDFGANVLKVEAPPQVEGRAKGLRSSPTGEARRLEAAFNPLDRNKKNMAINMRSEAGQAIFKKLAAKSDVLIEGFRPGVTTRLGVGYEDIKKLNPRIIYCSLSGYGQDGPYAQFPGHDINYTAIGGALSQLGEKNGVPTVPINIIADFAGASLHGAIAILVALAARQKTGSGQYIDISYTDAVISLMTPFTMDYFLKGIAMKRGETVYHGAYPYYAAYETKDNAYVSIGCLEPWLWENFCHATGREDLIAFHFEPEHRWSQPDEKKWAPVRKMLKEMFLTKTRQEWFDQLSGKDVPITGVNNLDEIFCDAHVKHRKMAVEISHPKGGKVRQVGTPFKMSGTPPSIRSLSPLLGEHTDEVLRDLGYVKPDIESLRQNGAVA